MNMSLFDYIPLCLGDFRIEKSFKLKGIDPVRHLISLCWYCKMHSYWEYCNYFDLL